MVELAKLMQPVEMVAGGIVYAFEWKKELYSIPVVTISLLIIYDKLWKRDNKSIWESITLGWHPGEILAGLIVATFVVFKAPNPAQTAAKNAIMGGR